MRNEIVLDFCIWEFEDITPDDITRILEIEPIKVYSKGAKRSTNSSSLEKKNGWRMNARLDKYASFEDQMNALLDAIEAKIDSFIPLCTKYYSEFSCALVIYYDNGESIPWVHLSSRYNNIAKELNSEFSIDIYCLPNE